MDKKLIALGAFLVAALAATGGAWGLGWFGHEESELDEIKQLLADGPSADHQKLADDTFERHVMVYSQCEMSWKNSQGAIKEADKFNIPVSGIPLPS